MARSKPPRLSPLRLARITRRPPDPRHRVRPDETPAISPSFLRTLLRRKITYTNSHYISNVVFENGLYKYSTGGIDLPEKLSSVFSVPRVALKIYTHKKPVTSQKSTLVQLISDINDGEAPRDLSTLLNRVCTVASRAFHLSNDVRHIHLQLFQSSRMQRQLRPSGSRLGFPGGVWTLRCFIRRESGSGIVLGRPYLELSLPFLPVYISGGMKPYTSFIRLVIVAHVRTQTIAAGLDDPGPSKAKELFQHTASPQAFMDGLSIQIARLLHGKVFSSGNAVVAAVKSDIIARLPETPIAGLVDFDHMVAEYDSGLSLERFISNTLLNPDGSAKFPLESSETSSPQLSEPSRRSLDVSEELFHELSPTVAEKIGIIRFRIKMDHKSELVQRNIAMGPSEIAREFERQCERLDETGLACCTIALTAFSKSLPRDRAFIASLESDPIPFTKTDARVKGSPTYILKAVVAGRYPRVQVILPLFPALRLVHPHSKPTTVACRIEITANYNPDKKKSTIDEDRFTLLDAQIDIITRMCSFTLERLCLEMEFESVDSAAEILAEAVLRSLQSPNPCVEINHVDLSLGSPWAWTTMYAARAESPADYFHTHPTAHQLDKAITSRQPTSTENEDKDPQQHGIVDGNTGTDPSTIVERGQIHHSANVSGAFHGPSEADKSSGDIGIIEKHDEDLKTSARESHFVLQSRSSLLPEDIASSAGIDEYKFTFQRRWTNESSTTIPTRKVIETAIEAMAQSSSCVGLRSLHEMFELVLQKNTFYTKFALRVRLTQNSESSSFDLAPYGRVNLILSAENPTKQEERKLFIQFPWSAKIRAKLRRTKSTKRIQLAVRARSSISATKNADSGDDLQNQMKVMLDQIYGLIPPLLRDRNFTDLSHLTTEVRSELLSKRQRFEHLIDVDDFVVEARWRDLAQISMNQPSAITSTSAEFAEINEYDDDEDLSNHDETEFCSLNQSSAETIELTERAKADEVEVEEQPCDDDERKSSRITSLNQSSTVPVRLSEHANAKEVEGEKQTSDCLTKTDSLGIFIALGSNVGDRVENIENACRELEADPNIRLVRTSALYETKPMYVEDQNLFLNGVCQIETTLPPMELLDKLQAIEQRLGRVKTIDKGPRNIDLDILLYNNEKVNTERLTIPHPLMLEREFVLRPLCDIGLMRFQHAPGSSNPYFHHLKPFNSNPQSMYPITPIAPSQPYIRRKIGLAREPTRVMSILNMTPDSFSDGGNNEPTNVERLRSTIASHIADGATMIDVGGQSSRPNAADVSAEEEISRILPVIEMIKSIPEAAQVAISVDTYRAPVAEAAVKAGAHIINDISAGQLDPNMLETIAKLGCTYVMMHMRGSPATMQSEENCTYHQNLIATIVAELSARVDAAQDAGIRRWRLILDPGIGFSKTAEQNLEILKSVKTIVDSRTSKFGRVYWCRPFPWLIGTSRKSFIGKVTDVQEPKDRIWGTAAAVTASIQVGADIVRVHDVKEMATVAKMADAIYRR